MLTQEQHRRILTLLIYTPSLVAQRVKRLSAMRETWVQSLGGEDPLEKWQPTPVLLPGKSHGQRSLVGYIPWGRKESDKTGRLQFLSLRHSAVVCLEGSLVAQW